MRVEGHAWRAGKKHGDKELVRRHEKVMLCS
jgi:hypothetical protein